MIFDGEFADPWGPDEPRESRFCFIGRNLDRQRARPPHPPEPACLWHPLGLVPKLGSFQLLKETGGAFSSLHPFLLGRCISRFRGVGWCMRVRVCLRVGQFSTFPRSGLPAFLR
jgi:hypothetical protein